MNDDLLELPSKRFAKRLLKEYRESDHPRDEKGRWTAGGVAGAALAGGALVGAALLAHRARARSLARARAMANRDNFVTRVGSHILDRWAVLG